MPVEATLRNALEALKAPTLSLKEAKLLLDELSCGLDDCDLTKVTKSSIAKAYGIVVQRMVEEYDINEKVQNVVFDELREIVLKPNVDYACTVHTYDFRGPVVDYEYTPEVKRGAPTDPTSHVQGPRALSGGLTLPVFPAIKMSYFNRFERDVMGLETLHWVTFVPDTWNSLNPMLRLFIMSGRTTFAKNKPGDLVTVEDMKCEMIWEPIYCMHLGTFIRFLVVKVFLDVTEQWELDSPNPIWLLPPLKRVYQEGATRKVKGISHSLYFTILRIFTIYKAVFWRSLQRHYAKTKDVRMQSRLLMKFDGIAYQAFKKFEPFFQYYLVEGDYDECFFDAISRIEGRYCLGLNPSVAKDDTVDDAETAWEASGSNDGILKSVERKPKGSTVANAHSNWSSTPPSQGGYGKNASNWSNWKDDNQKDWKDWSNWYDSVWNTPVGAGAREQKDVDVSDSKSTSKSKDKSKSTSSKKKKDKKRKSKSKKDEGSSSSSDDDDSSSSSD
ncbi:hypothetical protein FOZ60_001208 [Perkinsus olseni]|uniref:Uncharacterized protein n=1 Tax=Perkinsus olseni TaxID=32597 RepID=A0A7J6P1V7_PEROL|nr:hypothetical protein FOZ60_001208 [Perkinsus olseni]